MRERISVGEVKESCRGRVFSDVYTNTTIQVEIYYFFFVSGESGKQNASTSLLYHSKPRREGEKKIERGGCGEKVETIKYGREKK